MEQKNFPVLESVTPEQALVPTIDFAADRLTVSARDLHGFMGVKTAFKDWFPRMCEYGFTEGIDFCSFLSESTGGRPAHDAALTIDMAKEICMLQRNERGKQARQYFIQLEKDWNSPEKVMARALKIADAKINALTESNRALTETNAALTAEIAAFEPVKTYYEQILSSTGTLTTTQIAADYDLSAQKLNKILHEEGVQYKVNGQWILYTAYAGNGYTKSITIPIVRANGTPDAKLHTQWTQKGRLIIHDILTGRGITAKVDRLAS